MTQKKLNSETTYILGLLAKKREELISPFLDEDPQLIGRSFKYERNPAAFNLVRDCFFTLWVDRHIKQILEDDVSEQVRIKAMGLISELMNTFKSPLDDSTLKHELLKSQLRVIEDLLQREDTSQQNLNKLICSYERDKALFEREFLKYESELTQID